MGMEPAIYIDNSHICRAQGSAASRTCAIALNMQPAIQDLRSGCHNWHSGDWVVETMPRHLHIVFL